MIDYVGGPTTWDLVYTGGIQRLAQWASAGVVHDIAPIIKSAGDPKLLGWDDFTPAARRAVTFGEKVYGLTVATSEQATVYRKDLFAHPAEASAFQAKHGYALAAPGTYKQALDVAAFFTRKAGERWRGRSSIAVLRHGAGLQARHVSLAHLRELRGRLRRRRLRSEDPQPASPSRPASARWRR